MTKDRLLSSWDISENCEKISQPLQDLPVIDCAGIAGLCQPGDYSGEVKEIRSSLYLVLHLCLITYIVFSILGSIQVLQKQVLGGRGLSQNANAREAVFGFLLKSRHS